MLSQDAPVCSLLSPEIITQHSTEQYTVRVYCIDPLCMLQHARTTAIVKIMPTTSLVLGYQPALLLAASGKLAAVEVVVVIFDVNVIPRK